ncbi:MAG: FtsQ-type POTRA domain-containing protein [Parafannyhessea umbonata]|nr:FtsQ-type POTRA domain-containing protein [Parafannyhessea umbonata]
MAPATRAASAPKASGTSRPKAKLSTPPAGEVPQRKSGANRPGSDVVVRRGIVAGIVVAAFLLVALVGYLVLSYTPAFTITKVETTATKHISRASIAKLAKVPKGSTLLNLDEDKVTRNLKKNPWVGSVTYERKYPDTVRIVVRERKVSALVVMSAGDVVWYLGEGNVWIEPASIKVGESDSIDDLALAAAQKAGVMLITDVPASITPVAGSTVNSEVLNGVASYREQFGEKISSQIVSFSAGSVDSIGCTLKSGVQVSLGSPTNISSKEAVLAQILEKFQGKLTYVNVRVPTRPAYRLVDSDEVEQGTGVTGTDAAQDKSSSDASSSDASSSAASGDGETGSNASGQDG